MKQILSLILLTSLGTASSFAKASDFAKATTDASADRSLQAQAVLHLQELKKRAQKALAQKQQVSTFERFKQALYNNKKVIAGVTAGSAVGLLALSVFLKQTTMYKRFVENTKYDNWLTQLLLRKPVGPSKFNFSRGKIPLLWRSSTQTPPVQSPRPSAPAAPATLKKPMGSGRRQ